MQPIAAELAPFNCRAAKTHVNHLIYENGERHAIRACTPLLGAKSFWGVASARKICRRLTSSQPVGLRTKTDAAE